VKFFDVAIDKFQTYSKSLNEGVAAEKIFDELTKAFNESEISLNNIIGRLKMKIFFIYNYIYSLE